MKNILVTRPLPSAVLERAKKLGKMIVREDVSPLSKKELCEALTDYDIVLPTLGDNFSAKIFEQVENVRCRLLANFGVGYNHIDTEAAKQAGVLVTNTPGAVTDATADIALMLILMTCRRAGEGERLVRSGKWQGWHPVQMLGMHVTAKTVAIVGMGRIGEAIARRCHYGLNMNIVYANRSTRAVAFPAKQYSTISAAVSVADVVVVAVPGGSDTYHLINKEVFASMRANSIFINISRGDVVNETELIEALRNGVIGGAGLDVYEFEPNVPSELLAMENVVLLPHLGTASLEVRTQMGFMALDNINSFITGVNPPNLIS